MKKLKQHEKREAFRNSINAECEVCNQRAQVLDVYDLDHGERLMVCLDHSEIVFEHKGKYFMTTEEV